MGTSAGATPPMVDELDVMEELLQGVLLRTYDHRIRHALQSSTAVPANQPQAAAAQGGEAIFIFDWDDTLCPTTWLRSSVSLSGEERWALMRCERDDDRQDTTQGGHDNGQATEEATEQGGLDDSQDTERAGHDDGGQGTEQRGKGLGKSDDNLRSDDHTNATRAERDAAREFAEDMEQNEQDLQDFCIQVVKLLTTAKSLGRVVVVTNAGRPWVEASLNMAPAIKTCLTIHWIPLIFAVERMSRAEKATMSKAEFLTEAKVRAFQEVISGHYADSSQCAWNVVSVGDGPYERDALRQLARQDTSGRYRSKIVKLIEKSSLTSLAFQLNRVAKWLPTIANADHCVDIDLAIEPPEDVPLQLPGMVSSVRWPAAHPPAPTRREPQESAALSRGAASSSREPSAHP